MDEWTHSLLGQMIAALRGLTEAHPMFASLSRQVSALERQHAAWVPPPNPAVSETEKPILAAKRYVAPQPDHSADEPAPPA